MEISIAGLITHACVICEVLLRRCISQVLSRRDRIRRRISRVLLLRSRIRLDISRVLLRTGRTHGGITRALFRRGRIRGDISRWKDCNYALNDLLGEVNSSLSPKY